MITEPSAPFSGPPTAFAFSGQGMFTPQPKRFRCERGLFIYRSWNPLTKCEDLETELNLTPAQWQHFWKVCDEVEVWSWPEEVGNIRGICDGFFYSLLLEAGSRKVRSIGQTATLKGPMPGRVGRFFDTLRALSGNPFPPLTPAPNGPA
jgi:hypothetical protein